jgi:hypothetical protein
VVAPTIGLLKAMGGDTLFKKIDPEATIVGLPTGLDRIYGSSSGRRSVGEELIRRRQV